MAEDCNARWQTEEGEPVEVNQRALIRKVLARYPGEFTLFRELLQNSDDAQSSIVEIHFETATSKEAVIDSLMPPDLNSSEVVQWTFKNDGQSFTPTDWSRLTKIAEGNPNPAKVGAFGVGFYSVFSVTDRPTVSSGGHGMQFYWKDNKDQLFVRRGDLPSGALTTFQLPLREPRLMPPMVDFMRFLATSIAFMLHLKDVSIWFNHHCIGRVKKDFLASAEAVEFLIPLKRSTPSEMMVVDKIQRHQFTITAEIMHAHPIEVPESREQHDFCESPPQLETPSIPLQTGNPIRLYTAKLGLIVFTAEVDIKATKELSEEFLWCTSKEPPSRLEYNLVYINYTETGKDEYDRSFADQETQAAISIFQGLCADLNGALYSRIFIGHSTRQTTGIGGHMASRFIPTVERESIDLVNAPIWNKELLYVGGFLSRAVYELELSAIQTSWEKGVNGNPDIRPSVELQERLYQGFIHILKFFTFHHSTPLSEVAKLLQDSFYGCSASPLRFLSSIGVRPAPDIRVFDPLCTKFLKHVPILSSDVTQAGERTIKALPDQHKICTITLLDVLQDLTKHTLDEEKLVACLQWMMSLSSTADMTELLQVARFWGADRKALRLSSIRYFIGSKTHIPPNGPLPESVMPLRVTDHFASPEQLTRLVKNFSWKEFAITDWLQYISRPEIGSADHNYDFTRSIDWAECVLSSVSRAWSSSRMSESDLSVFENRTCIPTTHGLCRPDDSYLLIDTFDDLHLPIVHFPSGLEINAEMESLLQALKIRQYLPPRLLTRMVEIGKWSTFNLIDHLVRAPDFPTSMELSELKSSCVFAMEGIQKDASMTRFRADALYPPMNGFRQLHLPVIEWGERSEWQDTSPEAVLLYRLGLRRYPPLEVIMNLCSTQDTAVRTNAFAYLCTNLQSLYSDYNPVNFRHTAFLPAENMDGPCLEKLDDVFLANQWKQLGLSVIQDRQLEHVMNELGVQQHPPAAFLLHLLETKPPSNEEIARRWFEILSERIPSFSQHELDKLSQLRIVPNTIFEDREWLTPVQCYLERSTKRDFYSKLFHLVDFGHSANHFLRVCGAKLAPSERDIAESLIDNPVRFYEAAGGQERFLQEVRDLAARRARIPNDTVNKMMSKPVLLGERSAKTTNPDSSENYPLWEPEGIMIVDDINTYQLFEDSIIAAPREMSPELEDFYRLLGCRYLSTVVREQCNESSEILDTRTCFDLQALILERVPLFLRHYAYSRPEAFVSWSSFADSIVVRLWESLSVSKTLTINNNMTTKEQDMWATAKCEQGRIEIWISRSAKKDMYEIAVPLCRVLFGTVKPNDAHPLTAILSEDLNILKRRGYDVDRVITKCQQHVNDSGLADVASSHCSIAPESSSFPLTNVAAQQRVTETGPNTNVPSSQSAINQFGHLGGREVAPGSLTPAAHLPRTFTNIMNISRDVVHAVTRYIVPSSTSWVAREVMSRSDIRDKVNEAIEACNTGEQNLAHRDKDVDMNKFLKSGYCDIPGSNDSLQSIGKVGDVDVYIDQVILDADTFMERMCEPLDHFVRIITPIAKIYNLPMGSLRIFYNDTAGCIAFNCKGSLYLNLQYFEAWHYQDVKNGKVQQALSSWYFVLAHEIAHNLVTCHDAEHEFWFSAICEAHINEFSQLIGPTSV